METLISELISRSRTDNEQDDPFLAFSEWSSQVDEDAYRDL